MMFSSSLCKVALQTGKSGNRLVSVGVVFKQKDFLMRSPFDTAICDSLDEIF
jgi:hypothetical protein